MKKRACKVLAMSLAIVIVCAAFAVQDAHADTNGQSSTSKETAKTASAPRKAKAKRGKWKKAKGYYYYKQSGKKKKGLQKIGKRTYYFTNKGRQLTGWRCIKGKYYYFRIANGKKGYMIKNKKINGIKLGKDGNAKLNGRRSRRKVKIMVRCASLMDKVVKPAQSKEKKLKLAWHYLKKQYRKKPLHNWREDANWDLYYAEYMLNHKAGNCFCYSSLFAYMASAVGCYNSQVQSTGGHGWALVDGKIYDPSWSFAIGDAKCYAVPVSLGGTGGRVASVAWAKYKKDLRK